MSTPTPQEISANVRAAMARAGRTQQQLGEHLGLPQQSISNRMSGRTPWTVDQLLATSQYLGLPLGELLGASAARAN